jgi:hypothetical protein
MTDTTNLFRLDEKVALVAGPVKESASQLPNYFVPAKVIRLPLVKFSNAHEY